MTPLVPSVLCKMVSEKRKKKHSSDCNISEMEKNVLQLDFFYELMPLPLL